MERLNKLKTATLGDISRATGITTSHLSRVWSGHRNLSLGSAQRICVFAGCTVDDLMGFLEAKRTENTKTMAAA